MERKKEFLINAAYCAVIIGLLYLAVRYLAPVMLPFIIAFVIAAILVRPARFLAKKIRLQEKPVLILEVLLFYIFVFWAVLYGGSRLVTAAGNFLLRLPGLYQSEAVPILDAGFARLEELLSGLDAGIVEQIEAGFQQMTQSLGEMISTGSLGVVKAVSGYAAGIPSLIIKLVLTVIATFFIALDYGKVVAVLKKLLPEKAVFMADKIKTQGANMIGIYVKSYMLLMVLTFAELVLGLWLLGIPHAVWIALGIAVFDVLPVLGTGAY